MRPAFSIAGLSATSKAGMKARMKSVQISSWLPFLAPGATELKTYSLYSARCPANFNLGFDGATQVPSPDQLQ